MVVELLQHPGLEAVRIVDGQRAHDVEGALRLQADAAGDLLQLFHADVAPAAILVAHGVEVAGIHAVERGGGDLVHRGRGQAALAPLHHLAHEFPVFGDHHAHARAAGGETLGHRVDDDDVVLIAGILQGAEKGLARVDELAVDLVADQEEPVLLRDVEHEPELRGRQHGAGGIAGVGDEKGAGAFVDAGLDPCAVGEEVALLHRGGDRADLCAGEDDGRVVVGIEGLGDHDLVPVVQNGGEGHLQSLAAAEGGQDIVARQLHADPAVIAAHRVEQYGDAGRRRVGDDGLGKGAQRVKEGRGGLHVGLADVHMIDPDAAGPGLLGERIEFAHGGKPAALHFGGQLHAQRSFRVFLLSIIMCILLAQVPRGIKHSQILNRLVSSGGI